MNLSLKRATLPAASSIVLSGSKSETNRLLLLQALFPQIQIANLSNADDAHLMQNALWSAGEIVDIGHAGTAMRFLTAYFSIQEGREVLLTGSARMKERPISILVDALRQLGADIGYEERTGFPPLRIRGKKLSGKSVSLPADMSSQFVSALLLIAPRLENGLRLSLLGSITSEPYIRMTLSLLEQIGVRTRISERELAVLPASPDLTPVRITVESDWSSASYFYSMVALSEIGTEIKLSHFKAQSLQGDSRLANLYRVFGVETLFDDTSITLTKVQQPIAQYVQFNLNDTPDLAQTIAVTCFGLGFATKLTGLANLKIKESDRLTALRNELSRLGAVVTVTSDSLELQPSRSIQENVVVRTYNDHRMAMAFAPLALQVPLIVDDADVVSKSYPDFWNDLQKMGFSMEFVAPSL